MYLAAKQTHEFCHGKATIGFLSTVLELRNIQYLLPSTVLTYSDLRARFRIFYPITDKFGVSRHIFVEVLNIRFYEIPSVGNNSDI
jgi:hypothetical protein